MRCQRKTREVLRASHHHHHPLCLGRQPASQPIHPSTHPPNHSSVCPASCFQARRKPKSPPLPQFGSQATVSGPSRLDSTARLYCLRGRPASHASFEPSIHAEAAPRRHRPLYYTLTGMVLRTYTDIMNQPIYYSIPGKPCPASMQPSLCFAVRIADPIGNVGPAQNAFIMMRISLGIHQSCSASRQAGGLWVFFPPSPSLRFESMHDTPLPATGTTSSPSSASHSSPFCGR